ncbi:MAG: DNA polymerase, partial [Limnochordales bacterium]
LVHPETGRVHTHFNQTVAATGRLSSTNPNLQNIPVRTEQGRRIRKAFIPSEPGWVLLKADYSQIELRVLAHISGDETLIEAFRRGEDIHTRTAAEVFGLDPAEVTPERREAAKAINFGIVYGISSFGLAKGTGLSQEDAQRYIDAYFARYPGVKQYIEKIKAVGREQGYVTTLFNRRRYLPDLKSRNFARRSFAERTAMNTPIQGSAADIIKLAMVAAHRRLKEEGLQARLLLQVHDELVLELPREEVPRAAALIRDCMANVVELAVPLVVDIEQGPNWLETERVPGHA